MSTDKQITALDRLAHALDQSAYVYGRNWKDAIADPDWSTTNRHDWREYVPQTVRDCWPGMCSESRMAVYLMANEVTIEVAEE